MVGHNDTHERMHVQLNDQQQRAVEAYGAPLVIVAGAGTGKTTVMMAKINHLISTGRHAPHDILALTFTNKAANEMNHRFQAMATGGPRPYFGTFHSFCLRLLMNTASLDLVGLSRPFTIVDTAQQRDILHRLCQSHSVTLSAKEILSRISAIKQHPHAMHAHQLDQAHDDVQAVFGAYNRALRDQACVDFDDLILHAYFILQQDPRALSTLPYQYVMVDEYQDTNHIQHELCALLAQSHQNICVVGDFDQTIYGWRGAKVSNLLQFTDQFPTAITLTLDINYRSTRDILDAANQLIAFNRERVPKNLTAIRSSGRPVQHIICYDDHQEMAWIIQKIRELQPDYSLEDMAILYRTNQQSRVIEEALISHRMAHRVVGATPFYQRLEVKHALAYLQCLHHINQPVWFERAMLNPSRGVGKTSLQRLMAFCIERKWSIEMAIQHPDVPLQDRYLGIIREWVAAVLACQQRDGSVQDRVAWLFNHVGFETFIRSMENGSERWNNVQELVSKCSQATSLGSFLQDVALFQSADDMDDGEYLRCMTLHAAKGLEFPIVFIPGFEDGIMPIRNTDTMEEERRLAYVGLTRGKDHVYLLSAYKRSLMGDDWYHGVSTFSHELKGLVSFSMTAQVHALAPAMVFKWDDANIPVTVIPDKALDKPTLSAQNTVCTVGDVVTHTQFGLGTIESVSGDGDARMYAIRFSSGQKTLMAKFAPLTKVDT